MKWLRSSILNAVDHVLGNFVRMIAAVVIQKLPAPCALAAFSSTLVFFPLGQPVPFLRRSALQTLKGPNGEIFFDIIK